MPINVTDNSFEQDVVKASQPVLLDFWAEWCGPCKTMLPVLEDISQTLADKVQIAKINIDDNPMTPTKYGIRGIPTLMLFKDGQVLGTKVGAIGKSDLLKWIETLV